MVQAPKLVQQQAQVEKGWRQPWGPTLATRVLPATQPLPQLPMAPEEQARAAQASEPPLG